MLFCKPGDIESLLECLKVAVEMKETEYAEMANLAKIGHKDYVRPLDEYSENYLQLINQNCCN